MFHQTRYHSTFDIGKAREMHAALNLPFNITAMTTMPAGVDNTHPHGDGGHDGDAGGHAGSKRKPQPAQQAGKKHAQVREWCMIAPG